MEHPRFEGHVMPNEDEYQKSVQLKFRQFHGISYFTISLFITCIPAEEIDSESGYFRNFWTSMTTLDWVIWRTIMYHFSTSTYKPNSVQIGKTSCGCTDAPVVCFGSSSVFQFLFGYLGRCSSSFTSIDTLSAWHYDFQVCSRWWSRSNEYFDEFDCRKCLWCLAAELDFNPAGFTVVACASGYAWPVYNTRRNTLIWPAVQHVAMVVEVASSMPN